MTMGPRARKSQAGNSTQHPSIPVVERSIKSYTDDMGKDFSGMDTLTLWATAQTALSAGRLREARAALDELGLRFDDAYERLEKKIAAAGKETVWS